MKKNISKLIAQIESIITPQRKDPFKLTSKNFHQYTNKIFVNSQAFNKPSNMQKFISQQMQEYPTNPNVQQLNQKVKNKNQRPRSLDQKLSRLKTSDVLMMQEVRQAIKVAKKNQLMLLRQKLIRFEIELSFQLQKQDLELHVCQALQAFLKDLNQVINKSSKVV